ncbi:MAG: YbgC/FadM family acyl-CoA thioesterase [Candidatus Omnitrophota bacterium]
MSSGHKKQHLLNKKIYYHDTDCGGVVYYANYLKYLEEGRTEFLGSLGIDAPDYARKGVVFPVVRIEADYKAPARYGDKITVLTSLEKAGRASVMFCQQVKRDDILLFSGIVTLACVDSRMKTRPMPAEIREKIEEWISAGA